MRPAFSVLFLTTLCGAAQGLFIALVAIELASAIGLMAHADPAFYLAGTAATLVLGILGLAASFFHLGHPERAWRAIAMWRTSWLSRECLAVPTFLAFAFAYGAGHFFQLPYTLLIGIAGVAAAAVLFLCTAKIYWCLRFLQEWASPFTLVNFVLLGCASGFTLATVVAACFSPDLVPTLAVAACLTTFAGGVSRLGSLARNAQLHPKSTVQSATGIKNAKVVQKSRGFTSGSSNMKEFFHGKTPEVLRRVKVGFLLGAFVVPFVLVGLSATLALPVAVLLAAFLIQYAGLMAERWYFFAEARHPQNIYYSQQTS